MQIKFLRLGGVTNERYVLSDEGDLWNAETGRPIKLQDTGYLHVRIHHDGQYRNVRLHKAVAETFIRDIHKGEVVNHLDGDKKHNKRVNLEITTQSANVRHAIKMRNKLKEDLV